ncbi:MAG TPA: TadE family protein [Acidimicrobiales bacterium]|nr:TadE family protein [Acidimicrobiales bacterium]
MNRCTGDRGVVTTELVIVMPVLICFLFMVIAAGRLTDARSDVVGAAGDAARVASLQQSAAAARVQAQAAATDTVSGENLNCRGGPQVETEFLPGGRFERGATVHVEVTCTVDTRDLTFIGLPVSVTLFEEAWEPIDAYRSL